MAKYVIELFTNEKKYDLFSKASRKRVEENFDKEKIIPQYEKFYDKILNN